MSTARRDKTDEWDFRKPVSTEPKLGTCDSGFHKSWTPHNQVSSCVNWREGESAAAQPRCESCQMPLPHAASSSCIQNMIPPAAEQWLTKHGWPGHPDKRVTDVMEAYAAHVCEAAQHNEANLREAVRRKQVKDSIIRELRRKLAELEKALCEIGNAVGAPITDYASASVKCVELNAINEKASTLIAAALASLRAESKEPVD